MHAYIVSPLKIRAGLAATVGLSSLHAHACTTCDSATAQQVRSGIFDGHFLQTAAFITSPFVVLVLIVVILNYAAPNFALASGVVAD